MYVNVKYSNKHTKAFVVPCEKLNTGFGIEPEDEQVDWTCTQNGSTRETMGHPHKRLRTKSLSMSGSLWTFQCDRSFPLETSIWRSWSRRHRRCLSECCPEKHGKNDMDCDDSCHGSIEDTTVVLCPKQTLKRVNTVNEESCIFIKSYTVHAQVLETQGITQSHFTPTCTYGSYIVHCTNSQWQKYNAIKFKT